MNHYIPTAEKFGGIEKDNGFIEYRAVAAAAALSRNTLTTLAAVARQKSTRSLGHLTPCDRNGVRDIEGTRD